jgi:hypothetical protein
MIRTSLLAFAAATTFGSAALANDIVDTAVGAGSFTTLVAAVQAAGLVDTLKGEGPFTVFAPTDDAFAALPEGTVESLLLPENRDTLVSILTYHVVAGKVMSGDLDQRQDEEHRRERDERSRQRTLDEGEQVALLGDQRLAEAASPSAARARARAPGARADSRPCAAGTRDPEARDQPDVVHASGWARSRRRCRARARSRRAS